MKRLVAGCIRSLKEERKAKVAAIAIGSAVALVLVGVAKLALA